MWTPPRCSASCTPSSRAARCGAAPHPAAQAPLPRRAPTANAPPCCLPTLPGECCLPGRHAGPVLIRRRVLHAWRTVPTARAALTSWPRLQALAQITGLAGAGGLAGEGGPPAHVFQSLLYLRKLCSHPLLVLDPAVPQHMQVGWVAALDCGRWLCTCKRPDPGRTVHSDMAAGTLLLRPPRPLPRPQLQALLASNPIITPKPTPALDPCPMPALQLPPPRPCRRSARCWATSTALTGRQPRRRCAPAWRMHPSWRRCRSCCWMLASGTGPPRLSPAASVPTCGFAH